MDRFPLLEARQLTVRHGNHTALEAVNAAFGSGEVVAVIGERGAGKSTFLAALSGAIAPSVGDVFALGVRLTGAQSPVFEQHGVFRLNAGGGVAALVARLERALLTDGELHPIAPSPRVVLIDEAATVPATPFDRLGQMLRQLRDEVGVTVIRTVPAGACLMPDADRAIVLRDGRKVADGMPSEVAREVGRLRHFDEMLR